MLGSHRTIASSSYALAEELAPWHLARTFADIGVPVGE